MFVTLLPLALTLGVFAQTNHRIQVGDSTGATKFSPDAISANVGDTVTFEFQQKNHSVYQSSFADPCGLAPGGFKSQFFPVSPDQTSDFPTYTINVQDTKPIWVYCAQMIPVSHCHKGMVFAVNCGQDGAPNSFANFQAAAIAQGAADPSSPPAAAPTDAPSTISIPPAPDVPTVTATVTLASSTWTTTYGSYPNSPAPTPASLEGNVIKVVVGGNGSLTFNPSIVKALPRDTIVFEFQTKNHTATQAAFADPCVQLNNATTGQVGFDSGFMPVTGGSSAFPTFNFTVQSTSPVWVYCRQTNPASHCGLGMVMAINSDESSPRSLAAFATLAKEINGTTNVASSPSTGSTPSAVPSTVPSAVSTSGAARTTVFSTVGLLVFVGGFMAML